MARYQIHHRTVYRYEYPVAVSHHAACLKPLNNARQRCLQFNLEIDPKPTDLSERTDYFGNTVHLFSIEDSHGEFLAESDSEVTVQPVELPLSALTPNCEEVRQAIAGASTPELVDAVQYCTESPCVSLSGAVLEFAREFVSGDGNFLTCASELAAYIHDEFTFDPAATDASTPVEEVLKHRRGVCQDYAHLMIAALRAMCLPARYVSGYILTAPPPGQPRLQGADASHAWVSIFIPQFGWVDIDPTNRQYCNEEHLTVGIGRDFSDVSMLKGAVTGGGEHSIGIAVTVTPLVEPVSERLWIGGAPPAKNETEAPEPVENAEATAE